MRRLRRRLRRRRPYMLRKLRKRRRGGWYVGDTEKATILLYLLEIPQQRGLWRQVDDADVR